jgi:hypothetical protein
MVGPNQGTPMIQHFVKIANATFALLDDGDAQRVKDAAVTAVRAGGGLVEIAAEPSALTALVSPGVPVLFFTQTIDDDADDADGWNGFDINLDQYAD